LPANQIDTKEVSELVQHEPSSESDFEDENEPEKEDAAAVAGLEAAGLIDVEAENAKMKEKVDKLYGQGDTKASLDARLRKEAEEAKAKG